MGWLNVAVTTVPVTTLSLEFVLVGTFLSQLRGLDEITMGSVAAPPTVPGATATPGATAAKTLPIPPPATKKANSNAINAGSLNELSNLFIVLPFMSRRATIVADPSPDPLTWTGGDRSPLHLEAKPREELIYIDHLRQLIVSAKVAPPSRRRPGEADTPVRCF
jgi:hypothetical protein